MNQEQIEQIIRQYLPDEDYALEPEEITPLAQALAAMWPQWVPVSNYKLEVGVICLTTNRKIMVTDHMLDTWFTNKYSVTHYIPKVDLLKLLPTPPQTPDK